MAENGANVQLIKSQCFGQPCRTTIPHGFKMRVREEFIPQWTTLFKIMKRFEVFELKVHSAVEIASNHAFELGNAIAV